MVKKISFVIPIIHNYPLLYPTMNNIQTEMLDSSYDWEIIIAENSIEDPNTPKMKRLYRDMFGKGKFKYVFEPNQCGPCARNTGAFKVASGDYVMFMDAHTTLGKNTVDILADYLADHPDCGGISGLTSWSHYEPYRMGAHYELFHEPARYKTGGPSLPTHMHGHYMTVGHLIDKEVGKKLLPFKAVMGSQAYTMYKLKEFKQLRGYFSECRYYPHPEGYMPLKVWMTGQHMVVHPRSWHIHGMFHRHYEHSHAENTILYIQAIMKTEELSDERQVELVNQILSGEISNEGAKKREEYGGYSWFEHGLRNVLMIAYILGDVKWLDICYNALNEKHHPPKLPELKTSAIETVDKTGTREWLRNKEEMSLDQVLTYARKHRIAGMLYNWYDPIGRDPLK